MAIYMTVQSMMVNGKMVEEKVKDLRYLKMELIITVVGKMIKEKVKDICHIIKILNITVI